MITISKQTPEDITFDYPEIFKEVFKTYPASHIPGLVYIGYQDGAYVGFLSAYAHSLNTVYIQYAGLIESARNRNTLSITRKVLDELHKDFDGIMAVIDNTNSTALRMALACGFKVIGVRMSTDAKVFVELLKER